MPHRAPLDLRWAQLCLALDWDLVVPVLLALIAVGIIGFLLSYRRHKDALPLVLPIASAAIVYDSRYDAYSQYGRF